MNSATFQCELSWTQSVAEGNNSQLFQKNIWMQNGSVEVRKSTSLGCALGFRRIKMMLELKVKLSGEKVGIKSGFLRD